MIGYLEQNLYWAYEQAQRVVLAKQSLSDTRAQTGGDLYAAHHAAALLHSKVRTLPELQRAMIDAKYGLIPQGLNFLAKEVQQRFRLPETVAQGLVLHWLDHPMKPKLWQLADHLTCSERTVKRKSRDVQQFLNEICQQSLFALDS